MHLLLALLLVLLPACGGNEPDALVDAGLEQGDADEDPASELDADSGMDSADAGEPDSGPRVEPDPSQPFIVTVTLDGAPVAGAVAMQGGASEHVFTDANGQAVITLDPAVQGEPAFVATHPDARNWSADLTAADGQSVTVELTSFSRADNPRYMFQDPGTPDRRRTTAQCGHCHRTINDAWYDSPHRTSASNPTVHDLYSGAAHRYGDQVACENAGGVWASGPLPGGVELGERCYFGDGALHTLNACGDGACEDDATDYAECANCHAPGINGQIGGRGLHEARAFAYDYGVHCDVCHRVEDVVPFAEGTGVAGPLLLLRPSEEGPVTLGAGGFLPLSFGPHLDVINVRMGISHRPHYRSGTICAGCHQHDSEVHLPGFEADRARWPDGRIPVQSTFAEWRDGPFGETTPCNECHMPPDASVLNGSDWQLFQESPLGSVGGWVRAPGSVRRHAWFGPRQPESRMLELAAGLFLRPTAVETGWQVALTVRNSGAGHAIPTGEAMRSLYVTIDATCAETPLPATGGDVVPWFGGFAERREAGDDWTRWPNAQPGDRLVVTRLAGTWIDYEGWGPFGDGTFDAEAKGLARELYVGAVEILATDSDEATLSAALPEGDVVYRLPANSDAALAGMPGFGFARVMLGAKAYTRVPHFRATDVVIDNRLMPATEWTSEHTFGPCDDPTFTARLWYQAYPYQLADERAWDNPLVLVQEVRR